MDKKTPTIKIEFLTDDVDKIALAMKYWTYERGSFVFDLDELLTLHHNKSKRELAHTIALYATAWLTERSCASCRGRLTVDSRTDALSKIRDPKSTNCIQCAQRHLEADKRRLIEQKEAEVTRRAAIEAAKRALYKKYFNDLCTKKTHLEKADDFLALCIGSLEHSLKSTWREQRLTSSEVYQVFGWPLSSLLTELISGGVLRQDPYKMEYEQFRLNKAGTALEPVDLGSIKFQLPFKSQGGTVQKVFEEQIKNRTFTSTETAKRFLRHVHAAECVLYLLHLLRGHAINPQGALFDSNSKLNALLKRSECLFLESAPHLCLAETWKRIWVAYKKTTKAPWAGHSLDNFAKALESNIDQELQRPVVAIHDSQPWKRSCSPTAIFEYAQQKLGYSESSVSAA